MARNDITSKVCTTLLIELVNEAKMGSRCYEQFGVDKSVIDDLTRMNVTELCSVAETPFVQFNINKRTLNLTIQNMLRIRDKDTLLNECISKGCSREVMRHYITMSNKDFNIRREKLGLKDSRTRPRQLTVEQYEELAKSHYEYGHNNPIREKIDHLKTLLHLSKVTTLAINQIYQDYYKENDKLYIYIETGGSDATT